MTPRCSRLLAMFSELKLDAFLVSHRLNIAYCTGFSLPDSTERDCFFLLTRQGGFFFIFPTSAGLYPRSTDDIALRLMTPENRFRDQLRDIVREQGITSLGYEEHALTVFELHTLFASLPASCRVVLTRQCIEQMRMRKDARELAHIRRAARITDDAFSFLLTQIRRGVSEKHLAISVEFFLKTHSDGVAFPPIVAFNEHAAYPHWIPRSSPHLVSPSLLLVDFGARVAGYCADMTRVVFFGEPGAQQRVSYQTVLEAQARALRALERSLRFRHGQTKGNASHGARIQSMEKSLHPDVRVRGISGSSVDAVARTFLTNAGFAEYPHGLGHGVGLDIHEAPRMRTGASDLLFPGMVVTVEPALYVPGKYGVRIEDLVLLQEDGVCVLSHSPKTLTVVSD